MTARHNPWDKLATIVNRARRSEDQPDEHGFRALARIEELLALQHRIERLVDKEVIGARDQGATWANIGGALGTTRQGAHQRHRRVVEHDGGMFVVTSIPGFKEAGPYPFVRDPVTNGYRPADDPVLLEHMAQAADD